MVVEAAGGTHEDGIGTLAHAPLLGTTVRAAHDELYAEVWAMERTDAAELGGDLTCEFTCRRHYDGADGCWCPGHIGDVRNALNCWQPEAEGFAGASAGSCEEILACERGCNGGSLDGSCEFVPKVLEQCSLGGCAQPRNVCKPKAGASWLGILCRSSILLGHWGDFRGGSSRRGWLGVWG